MTPTPNYASIRANLYKRQWNRYEARLWRKIRKRAVRYCWEWTGYIDGTEPMVAWPNADGALRTRPARRVVWEVVFGVTLKRSERLIPRCGNAACVRPWPGHVQPAKRGEKLSIAARLQTADRCFDDRFWAKIRRRPDGCWLWVGGWYENQPIYQPPGVNHKISVHRALYERLVEPLPPKRRLMRHCAAPLCVRPGPGHRWPSQGTARGGRLTVRSVEEDAARFWSRVQKPEGGGCWEWVGPMSDGREYPQPQTPWQGVYRSARQVAWFLVHGGWSSLQLRPVCGNRRCIRPHPWHLVETKTGVRAGAEPAIRQEARAS